MLSTLTHTFEPEAYWRIDKCYTDGRVEEGEWQKNQIQHDWATLAAILFRSSRAGAAAPTSGLSFVAIGEGDVSWDLGAPSMPRSQQTLESELWRQAIDAGTQVYYIDPGDMVSVSITPTRVIQINFTVPFSVVGTIRELALFGGDATAVADTGYMFNWYRISAQPKTVDFALSIRVQVRFQVTA